MKVRLSQAALEDLRSIARWIASDRPNAARKIAKNLRAACLALGDTPRAYEILDEKRSPAIRRRPFSRYLICYRIEDSQIVVVRILDGARNIEPLL
jgi:plasmid stabilization system protein ParE